MKKSYALTLFTAIAIFVSSILTPPAAADKTKTGQDKDAKATARKPQEKSEKAKSQSGVSDRAANALVVIEDGVDGEDPDLPAGLGGRIDKEAFLQKRSEAIARLRGVEPGRPFDASARGRAIAQMDQRQAQLLRQSKGSLRPEAIAASWTELGPNPIPNGQTSPPNPVSGRVTAIEIHPTNPNLLYVGTAQGGVFRSSDGGANWVAIFDNAQSLAIGALALAPSNPSILYVGTGEPNGSVDSFAGVGLYRIDNADTTTGALADLKGPINPTINANAAGGGSLIYQAFNGRTITKILVLPNDASTIFVGVASGVIGIGGDIPLGNSIPPLGLRGLYRLTNATAANPASVVATRIGVSTSNACFDSPCTGNRNVNDMVFDPADASGNTIILWLNGISTAGDGGIYRTTSAMAATPGWTQVFQTTTASTSTGRGTLAIYKPAAGSSIVYAASGESSSGTSCANSAQSGALRKSIDGGVTWSAKLTGGGGFCGTQCFYNLGLAVQPGATTATDKVLIGGNVSSASCQRLEATSTDGGTTFINAAGGLHADTHVIRFAPSDGSIVYRGDDGGIWKSSDGGATWTSLNNSGFKATQFMGIALHPTNRDFTLGGTQDNGTNQMQTGPAWLHVDNGDGGFTLIDQNASDTTNVIMYHTYFNASDTLVGFAETDVAGGGFVFRGCQGTTPGNGITCSDAVNFYAPLAQGPGNPNTVYYGTDRLYRSPDKGLNNGIVSQVPIVSGVPISSIAVSPQDDNYRIVGLDNGAVVFTTSGSSTLAVLDAVGGGSTIPDKYIGRALFDPSNKNTAYIGLGGYMGSAAAANSHLWRVTNLNSSPAIVAINGSGATGLPDIPINALAVDPLNSNALYVGTDIGVYFSADGGTTWNPFGFGLPRVAVFGMGIQNTSRVLRIATHGRGMWEIPVAQTNTQIQFTASSYAVGEGDGKVIITATRTGDISGTSSADFATGNGTASQRTDYLVRNGTMTFTAGVTSKSFSVPIIDDVYVEPTETINLTLSSPVGAVLGSQNTAFINITDNDAAGPSIAQKRFGASFGGAEETPPNASVASGQGYVLLNGAETSANVSLQFSNLSSAETGAHIHAAPSATPGPIIFPLPTTNPVTDFQIAPTPQQVADLKAGLHYMNIHSANFPNGEIRGQLLWNPTMEDAFFVRQQFLDFLGREPDAGGLSFWVNRFNENCVSGVQCFHNNTIGVSDAFFFEPEFHQTAGFVFLVYRAAYGNSQPFHNPDGSNPAEANKLPDYATFTADRARVVGGANLTASQQAFANLLVTRSEFTNKYGAGLNTGALFVDAVLANIQAADGVDLTAQRQALIDQYNSAGGGNAGRAQVMYLLGLDDATNNPINNRAFVNAEYNRQFALTLYFGYLRRNPDIGGFLFWQSQINSAAVGDVPKQQALVCSFVTAPEYQLRFGPNTPRNNRECPQ
ncbi:MAG: hypothetical protein JWM21_1017 [Acidobacteria bacterium]|nr:hypothetical protein [Acidobacteriota bacterium]